MKLSPWMRFWLYGILAVLLLSGIGWFWLDFFSGGAESWDPRLVGSKLLLLKIHGAAAMVFLVVFGTLIPGHIKTGIAAQRNRFSGGLMIGVLALLSATGYALYYGGEDLRSYSSQIHTLLGVATPAVLAFHVLRRRRTRVRRRRRASSVAESRLDAVAMASRAKEAALADENSF